MGYQCLGEGAGSLPFVPTLYYYCRLYLNGARVGYQCLGEGAGSLPFIPTLLQAVLERSPGGVPVPG